MSTPTLKTYLALSTRPTEASDWIDESDKVRLSAGVHLTRGRQRDLDVFEAGSATCTLDNRDRRFDPSYQGEVGNLVVNPSFEGAYSSGVAPYHYAYSTGGASGTRSESSTALYGAKGQRLTKTDGGAGRWGINSGTSAATATTIHTIASVYVISFSPGARIVLYTDFTAGPYGVSQGYTLSAGDVGSWITLSRSTTVADIGDTISTYVWIEGANADVIVDGHHAGPSSLYTDGDQDNCRWSGAPHASTSYRGGPYYGDLKPMRRVRHAAVYDGVEYPLFAGYVDGFRCQWPGSGKDAIVPLRALDGLRVLALNEIPADTTFPEQLSSERIDAILDATGWTTGAAWVLDSATNSQLDSTTILAPVNGDRMVFVGDSTVQAETLADATNALQYAQSVERAEGGRLFVNAEGAVCFYNRHYLLSPAQQTSRWTFADESDPTGLPYHDLETAYDDGDLYNAITVERRGGTAQTSEDATSKLEYFRRATSETDLLITTDDEAADRAAWLLSRRKDPAYRVKALTIRPQRDDRLWVPCLSAEIGDRITVSRLPQGIGSAWTEDYRIERIEWTIQGGLWQVVWQLSPADSTLYWHVSDGSDEYAPFAILGTSTVLAY